MKSVRIGNHHDRLVEPGVHLDALLPDPGSNDHLAPPAINRANMRKYVKNSTAVTDYREFPNRTHHTVGQKGWEEVAESEFWGAGRGQFHCFTLYGE